MSCPASVTLGSDIVIGQIGLPCIWTVTTSSTAEHFVTSIPVLNIANAGFQDEGTYKCYVNGGLVLTCLIQIIYSSGLSAATICTGNKGQNLTCLSNPPSDVSLYTGQTFYGACTVTGIPSPDVQWMFCPNTCHNITLSDLVSSSICHAITNLTVSSSDVSVGIQSNSYGLYACYASNVDITQSFYNVCLQDALTASDCNCSWYTWKQAAVAITTIDAVITICFLAAVVAIYVDFKSYTITNCNKVLVLLTNHCIGIIMAIMMIIGCAMMLCDSSVTGCNWKWAVGVIVMYVLLLIIGIISAIFIGIKKLQVKLDLTVVILWDVLIILICVVVLIWTLVIMGQCRNNNNAFSNQWSWEIFLITLFIAIVIFLILTVIWFLYNEQHCRGCFGTTTTNCQFNCQEFCSGECCQTNDCECSCCGLLCCSCCCYKNSRKLVVEENECEVTYKNEGKKLKGKNSKNDDEVEKDEKKNRNKREEEKKKIDTCIDGKVNDCDQQKNLTDDLKNEREENDDFTGNGGEGEMIKLQEKSGKSDSDKIDSDDNLREEDMNDKENQQRRNNRRLDENSNNDRRQSRSGGITCCETVDITEQPPVGNSNITEFRGNRVITPVQKPISKLESSTSDKNPPLSLNEIATVTNATAFQRSVNPNDRWLPPRRRIIAGDEISIGSLSPGRNQSPDQLLNANNENARKEKQYRKHRRN